jgi:hypothetical protein
MKNSLMVSSPYSKNFKWEPLKVMQKMPYKKLSSKDKNRILSAKRSLLIMGLSFIAVGFWAIWTKLSLGKSTRAVASLFISTFDEQSAANALFVLCIVVGVIMLAISQMKPSDGQNNKY